MEDLIMRIEGNKLTFGFFSISVSFLLIFIFFCFIPKEKKQEKNRIASFLIAEANLWTHPKSMRGGFIKNQRYLKEIKSLTSSQESNLCEIGGLYKYKENLTDGSIHWYCTSKEMITNAIVIIDRPNQGDK